MPSFHLRFKSSDRAADKWVRRNLFMLGWSPVWMKELSTPFGTRDQAVAFAREQKIEKDVDVVTITAEDAAA